MKPLSFSVVHGHTIEQLAELLVDAHPYLDGLILKRESLGGWTHINLLGYQEDNQFVVKLPSLTREFDSNPFKYQFRISEQLYTEKICPEPIVIGNLSDANDTPFMVTRYISGRIHTTVETFSQNEFAQLFQSLHILSKMKLRNIRTFANPQEMLEYFLSLIHLDEEPYGELPTPLRKLIRQNEEMMERMQPNLGSLNWVLKPIHGDLTESNIVFTGDKAVLLDFEACCIGSPVFDIAYLYNQAPYTESKKIPEIAQSRAYSKSEYFDLIPLVLSSVITWTIKRLTEIEQRIVELNFDNIKIKKLLYSYLIEKSELLSKLV